MKSIFTSRIRILAASLALVSAGAGAASLPINNEDSLRERSSPGPSTQPTTAVPAPAQLPVVASADVTSAERATAEREYRVRRDAHAPATPAAGGQRPSVPSF
jgi:hypothetical protein